MSRFQADQTNFPYREMRSNFIEIMLHEHLFSLCSHPVGLYNSFPSQHGRFTRLEKEPIDFTHLVCLSAGD